MKKSIALFAALLVAFSCDTTSMHDDCVENPVSGDQSEMIDVVLTAYPPVHDSDDPDLKSVISDGEVYWESGDEAVLHMNRLESKFSANVLQNTTYFAGAIPSGMLNTTYGYFFYPSTVKATGENLYSFSYGLPQEQMPSTGGSFGPYNLATATIYSKAISSGRGLAAFLNGCALLKITFPEDVSFVTVSSNSSVPLTGEAKFELSEGHGSNLGLDLNVDGKIDDNDFNLYPTIITFLSGVPSVLLSNGMSLLNAGTAYHIVVWPGTHPDGLTFTFANSEGQICEKVWKPSVTPGTIGSSGQLVRNKVYEFRFTSEFVFEHKFEVSEDEISFGWAESEAQFSVTSSRNWTAVSDSDWLEITPSNGGASASAVAVTVSAEKNEDESQRTAVVTVKAGDADTKTITVTQAAFVPELNVSSETLAIAVGGGDTELTIESNMDWTIANDSQWLTLSQTSGSGDAALTISAGANTGGSRTATLTIGSDRYGVEKTVTVTQAAAGISYDNVEVGDYFYSDGSYSTELDAGKTAVGVVFWVGNPTADDPVLRRDYPDCTHGLVVGMVEEYGILGEKLNWDVDGDIYITPDGAYYQFGIKRNEPYASMMTGYNNTYLFKLKGSTQNGVLVLDKCPEVKNASSWFYGSIAEFEAMNSNLSIINPKLSPSLGTGRYATVSEERDGTNYQYLVGYSFGIGISETQKGQSNYHRPIFAF